MHRLFSRHLLLLWPGPGDSYNEFENTRSPAEAVEQDWALGEIPHAAEIQSAIERWTIDGEWPELSDGARYCIRMRMNAAADFVALLEDYIPTPQGQTDREIARWFLLEWWPRHGRGFFARQISGVPEAEE